MNEQNRNRLARVTGRYAERRGSQPGIDRATFDAAFRATCDAIVVPAMRDVADILAAAGHAPRIAVDEAAEAPSVELALGINGAPGRPNLVGFCVIERRGRVEVLSYLNVARLPMDLHRYAHPSAITAPHVEQLLVDAVEQIFAVNGG